MKDNNWVLIIIGVLVVIFLLKFNIGLFTIYSPNNVIFRGSNSNIDSIVVDTNYNPSCAYSPSLTGYKHYGTSDSDTSSTNYCYQKMSSYQKITEVFPSRSYFKIYDKINNLNNYYTKMTIYKEYGGSANLYLCFEPKYYDNTGWIVYSYSYEIPSTVSTLPISTGSNLEITGECKSYCTNNSTDCSGTAYYVCENNQWINKGQVEGQCGIICINGKTKCEGNIYYECSNNQWISKGQIIGYCGNTIGNIIKLTMQNTGGMKLYDINLMEDGTTPKILYYSFSNISKFEIMPTNQVIFFANLDTSSLNGTIPFQMMFNTKYSIDNNTYSLTKFTDPLILNFNNGVII